MGMMPRKHHYGSGGSKWGPAAIFLIAMFAGMMFMGLMLYRPLVLKSTYTVHLTPAAAGQQAASTAATPAAAAGAAGGTEPKAAEGGAGSKPEPAKTYESVVPEWPDTTNVSMPGMAAQVLAAERAGKGRKVISMALYGDKPRYTAGAIDNAVIARRDWEGWTFRIYYAEGVPTDVLDILRALGTDLVKIEGNQRGAAGMFWRFYALEDPTATRVIIRDTDSRITHRDKAAVDEWIESGRYFHTMNDNPAHGLAILGGMWGAVNGLIHPKVIQAWRDQDKKTQQTYSWGADQNWLQAQLWPAVKAYTLQHASFMCGAFGAAEWKPFPTKRQSEHDFVGIVYAPDNFFEGLPLITADCPANCRKDPAWTKC